MFYKTSTICLPLTLFLLVICPGTSLGQERTWNDKSGNFSVKAELVELTSDAVKLKRSDTGKEITVPLDQLSDADHKFLAEMAGDESTDDDDSAGAAVKVSGKMIWSDPQFGDGEPTRNLQLEIIARGKPAAEAVEFGMLQVDSITTDQGQELEMKKNDFSIDDLTSEFKKVDRADKFFDKHPARAVRIVVHLADASEEIKQVASASGTFKIKTGGEHSNFKIEKATSLAGQPLEMPEFEELGITAEIKADDQELRLELEGAHAAIQRVEVRTPAGKEYSELNGNGQGGGGSLQQYFFQFENQVPEDAVLNVYVVKNAEEVDVPFKFENLRVPKKPTN